ncbi:MAG: sporulation integral membrane protein YtvI [Clostridiales bacterium]|jgi:sporulation integral membrane protein YtvI|nr:sporulation integral membrane protein YtvI [Clostridiales bacterium]
MSDKTRRKFEFIVDVAFVALVLALVYVAVKYAIGFIMPFIIAVIVVAAFRPLSKAINRRFNVNKGILSVALTLILYLALAGVAVLLILKLISFIKDAAPDMRLFYKESVEPALYSAIMYIQERVEDVPVELGVDFDMISADLMARASNAVISFSQASLSVITGVTKSLPVIIMNTLFTITLSFFVSIYYDDMIAFFKSQLPEKWLGFARETRVVLADTVFKYIKAYITLMLITFAELSIGLSILRTRNAIFIAAGAALFDALPIFGAGGIIIPWIIVKLITADYSYAIGLAILYAAITLVRNIIEPKIIGDQLGLNPILSLMSIYLGFRLLGVPGMIMFPITLQIFIALHKKGRIRLYKSDDAG